MKNYIYLMRLNKPTGFLLLFWPCSWGMAYNLNYLQISYQWFYFLFLFFVQDFAQETSDTINKIGLADTAPAKIKLEA